MTNETVHNYTKTTTVGKWLVSISPSTNYGYFENQDSGVGGGLWFESGELVDADGTYSLPKDVARGIRQLGYKVVMRDWCI